MKPDLPSPFQGTMPDTRPDTDARPLLAPGRNCWRMEPASRVAFLVDGAAYYEAFVSAVERARRSILVIGWDIDSNLKLERDGDPAGAPTLARFLNRTVAARRQLHAHVLIWDFAMIYALEREWLPEYRLGWRTHRRVHFSLDGEHPVGASQHQKIVVVDDRIAFVGGLDLAKSRWDTPEHRADDPRRVDPDGSRYPPFHDVQMLVEGEAARALGDLARARWAYATGETLAPPGVDSEPWPPRVQPDLDAVTVAIARTHPRFRGNPEVREVESFYVEAIAAARRYIYIENQYFTSSVIADSLIRALKRPDGPEVILVLPQYTGGWLEQNTMDALRRYQLERLRRADRHGRLGVYYPVVPGLTNGCVGVHSKLFVADGRLLTVGSANLSNRSMGLDSECNLILEANEGDGRVARGIGDFRDRLLAEHMGCSRVSVADALARDDSLKALIAGGAEHGRGLRPLDVGRPSENDRMLAESKLIDPERPVEPEELARRIVPKEARSTARRRLLGLLVLLLLLAGLAAAWRWTPLSEWLDIETMSAVAEQYSERAYTPLLVVAVYLIGGLVVLPVTLLVVVTVLVFGPVEGFLYALGGALLSAALNFWIGHVLGRESIQRIAGGKLNRISRRLAKRELLTVITLRVVPVAPFAIVNLMAGASHIRFSRFVLGTILGMGPGIFALTLFIDTVTGVVRQPSAGTVTVAALVVIGAVLAIGGLRRWLRRRSRRAGAGAG